MGNASESLYLRRQQLMRSVVVQTVGLVGYAAFLYGLWSIYWPAAFVVGGALLMLWAILKMRWGG